MLKRGLLSLFKFALFVGLVWLVVIAYWKYTDHVVAPEDLLIYFLFVPAGLLLAYVSMRTAWRASRKSLLAQQTPSAAAVSAPGQNGSQRRNDVQASAPSTYVLATAISTYFGDEGERFVESTLVDKMRVEIDTEFTQAFGYGIRVAGVDLLELAAEYDGARATLVRTCALLKRIYGQLEDLLISAAPNTQMTAGKASEFSSVRLHLEWLGTSQPIHVQDNPPLDEGRRGSMPAKLSVHIVLPAFLNLPETAFVQAEIMTWLEKSGWPPQALSLRLFQPESETTYFHVLQAWQHSPVGLDANEWLLILSAVSWLDADLLNDKLYKEPGFARQMANGGSVIGEVACGMVLATTRPAADLHLDAHTCLSVISSAPSGNPIDAKGTTESAVLDEMLAAQRAALSGPAESFSGLVTSGDLSQRRVIALGRWVTDSLPQLDFIEDILCVGDHVGECEPAGSLLALALANAMALQRQGGILFCANQHPEWRMLAVIKPAI